MPDDCPSDMKQVVNLNFTSKDNFKNDRSLQTRKQLFAKFSEIFRNETSSFFYRLFVFEHFSKNISNEI